MSLTPRRPPIMSCSRRPYLILLMCIWISPPWTKHHRGLEGPGWPRSQLSALDHMDEYINSWLNCRSIASLAIASKSTGFGFRDTCRPADYQRVGQRFGGPKILGALCRCTVYTPFEAWFKQGSYFGSYDSRKVRFLKSNRVHEDLNQVLLIPRPRTQKSRKSANNPALAMSLWRDISFYFSRQKQAKGTLIKREPSAIRKIKDSSESWLKLKIVFFLK
jgi:hypothetical protein